jgi:hypothetical protein
MFKQETQAGNPIQVGKIKIIPVAQVVKLQPPGFQGGLIWNRPVWVQVYKEDGSHERIPVFDFTRLAQIILAGLALGVTVFWVLNKFFRR